jgi:SAM-dependent methyltransferase
MHRNSKMLFARYARPLIRPGARVLEIGPEAFPSAYQRTIVDESAVWHTLDIRANASLTYPGSGEHRFPVSDSSYDIVLAGNVIEHVRNPWLWVREVARVCRRGGHAILLVPVSWPYHAAPIDCWRIYPEGMKALLEEAGLEVVECRCESFEAPGYRRYTPGKSPECQSRALRWFCRVAGLVGFPVERAYDTVAIGRKR